jgi:UDP-N-acetylmuramyl pentapeptide synthase
MGMNHPGEIDYLTRIARPDVALVNNALRAHLEGLGSVEAVARAKGEIYAGLSDDGIAIVNADDPHAELWRSLAAPRQVMSFGFAENADVRIIPGNQFDLATTGASKQNCKYPANTICATPPPPPVWRSRWASRPRRSPRVWPPTPASRAACKATPASWARR